MAINYAEQFLADLEQKYSRELVSGDFTMQGAKFVDAKTIKIPRLEVGGYKEHSRSGGYNRQSLANDWEVKMLSHDRDVEFFADAMDVDETNQVLSAANVTKTFEEEQAIPELDAYRFSKIYYDYTTTFGKTADTTPLTDANVLIVFDRWMEEMDDAGVPETGRILYVTATVNTMIKNAEKIYRAIIVGGANDGRINRAVRSLDDVTIKSVPKDRFKTAYDFTDGFEPAQNALQIQMMLVHPRSVIAADKHNSIYLWAPGTHTEGDGWLYQNRRYGDLFLIEKKIDGVKINVDTGAVTVGISSIEQVGGTSGSVNSTGIKITFDKDVVGLESSHITLSSGSGSATKGTVSGFGKVWTLAISNPVEGNVGIKVSGLAGYAFPATPGLVNIYSETIVAVVSAVQQGGASGGTPSTGIKFTFDKDVTGLQASHFTITAGTGSATKGTLSGSAKEWTLALSSPTSGTVSVGIAGLTGYRFPAATIVEIYGS